MSRCFFQFLFFFKLYKTVYSNLRASEHQVPLSTFKISTFDNSGFKKSVVVVFCPWFNCFSFLPWRLDQAPVKYSVIVLPMLSVLLHLTPYDGYGYEICFYFFLTFLNILNNMDYTITYFLHLPTNERHHMK